LFDYGDSENWFSEGLAQVRIGDTTTGKAGYIDKTGKMVIIRQFNWVRRFSEGRATVRIREANFK
jgi:hypothetical protein